MDFKDVSGRRWVLEDVEFWQNVLNRASRRKGELVSKYHPPDQLISRHLESLELSKHASDLDDDSSSIESDSGSSPSGTDSNNSSCKPDRDILVLLPPYLPCERRITDLEPIFIKDMRLETHHRGRRVLVRVLTPGMCTTGVMAVVEDEQGTALTLHARHQPTNVPSEEFMRPDDVFLLKEPYLVMEPVEKEHENWDYRLRVDHVSDIVKMTSVDDMIPEKWRRTPEDTSEALRVQGHEAAQKKKWAEALRFSTSAIAAAGEHSEDRRLAHLDRSLANYRLFRPEHTREDAKHGSKTTPPPWEGLWLEALALYDLGDFAQSLECIERIPVSCSFYATIEKTLERVKARLREQQEGVYDFTEMYRQAKRTPPFTP